MARKDILLVGLTTEEDAVDPIRELAVVGIRDFAAAVEHGNAGRHFFSAGRNLDAIVMIDLEHDLGRPTVRAERLEHFLLHLPAELVESRVGRGRSVFRRGHSRIQCTEVIGDPCRERQSAA